MSFGDAEGLWLERFGLLRNVVRQHVIARQLDRFVRPGSSVVDVGCGQGTQLVRLAREARRAVGVDPSERLLGELAAAAAGAQVTVEVHHTDLAGAAGALGGETFDVVCAHGLLMYLDDVEGALALLASLVAPGGLLSVTFRNADALALRAGLRSDWAGALRAFEDHSYLNELGVTAQAHRLGDIERTLASLGFGIDGWFGVRVLCDSVPVETPAPEGEELAALLEAEDAAGSRDPYRALGSQLHVIARRRA